MRAGGRREPRRRGCPPGLPHTAGEHVAEVWASDGTETQAVPVRIVVRKDCAGPWKEVRAATLRRAGRGPGGS
ncbi:DUF5980 family protein [Streptomyces sp. TRM 70361]|uniref:DUF5980 family protein n=1 Tax=Streptomyces sp. TRM 70361 TaxID=3116553 RepID=UPI003FCCB761